MKIPDYPNNREADEKAISHCNMREGALEVEAKSGDLFTHYPLGGGASYVCIYLCSLFLESIFICSFHKFI